MPKPAPPEPFKASNEERSTVERERDELKDFIKTVTGDDIKSGNWFSKLLRHALDAYTNKWTPRTSRNTIGGFPPTRSPISE